MKARTTDRYKPHFRLHWPGFGPYWRVYWRDTGTGDLLTSDMVPYRVRLRQTVVAHEFCARLNARLIAARQPAP